MFHLFLSTRLNSFLFPFASGFFYVCVFLIHPTICYYTLRPTFALLSFANSNPLTTVLIPRVYTYVYMRGVRCGRATFHTATVHTAGVHTDPFTPTTIHTDDRSHRRPFTPTTVNTDDRSHRRPLTPTTVNTYDRSHFDH